MSMHAAPGSGPVKIAAAIAIAAAGLGGGIAYKKFREYLRQRKLHPTHAKQAKNPPTKKAKGKSKRPANKNPAPTQCLYKTHPPPPPPPRLPNSPHLTPAP